MSLTLIHGSCHLLGRVALDGYHTDAQGGDYSWAVPDEQVIAALNANAADVGTPRDKYECDQKGEKDGVTSNGCWVSLEGSSYK